MKVTVGIPLPFVDDCGGETWCEDFLVWTFAVCSSPNNQNI